MAVPKRKHSHARTAKRRANFNLKAPGLSECPRCGQSKLPHCVCGKCGYYGEREVLTFDNE